MAGSRAFVQVQGSSGLVFCMDWFAVIGRNTLRQSRRLAHRRKATHMTWDDAAGTSVGVVTLARWRTRRRVLYSAAQLAAAQYVSATVALLHRLGPHSWWLVAIHEGAVVARTDHVYNDVEQARAAIKELRQAYPTLRTLEQDTPFAPEDMSAAAQMKARLHRVPWRPVRLAVPAAGLALMLAAWVFSDAQALLAPDTAADDLLSADDASLWAQARRTALDAHWVHGVAGTSNLLDALYRLPLRTAGWKLLQVQCHSAREHWRCEAQYRRAEPEASNQGFRDAARADWSIRFAPLEEAQVSWSWVGVGIPASLLAMNDSQHTETQLFSHLQGIQPAFAAITIAAARPLSIGPLHNERGEPVALPSGWRQPRMRGLDLRGPLRSVSMLLPHSEAVSWQRVALSVDDRVVPGLTESRLAVSMQGVLYDEQ